MAEPQTNKPHPWRWMVFCARFLSTFITLGSLKSMGVFLPNFMDSLASNTATAGFVGSVVISMGGIIVPLVGVLMNALDSRKVSMIGGVICASCLTCSAFSQSMLQLGFWFAGSSLALTLIQVSIVKPLVDYFPDDFAAANGMGLAGGAVGIMVMPPVMAHLTSTYGWRGALALLGAFSFNYVLCGALLRPLERPQAAQYKRIPGTDGAGREQDPVRGATGETSGETDHAERAVSICGKCRRIVSGGSDDMFTTTKWLLFQAMMLACGVVFGAWHLFMIPQGAELGFSDGPAADLAIFAGVGSLTGRLAHGALVDRGLIRAPPLFALSSLVFAASCLVNPLAESYAALAALGAVGGVAIGVFFSLTFVISREIAGDQYMSLIGRLYLFLNFGQIIGGTISGWLHDVSRSYGRVFVFNGTVAIFMSACPFVIDCLDKVRGARGSVSTTAGAQVE